MMPPGAPEAGGSSVLAEAQLQPDIKAAVIISRSIT
jgi:hypothetical protein